MNRVPVESSNIVSIGYTENNETLEVEFKNGGVYQYFEVPKSVYFELMEAESKGQYLNRSIKPAYRFEKVT
ncbi:hypothetical protein CPT_Seuss83 [Caulobacter phage Seuss]|uniref:KTSC domain-containing protein n=1 Tax=Caulobacter phage Seuss TaxID=1675601 RepID=A0A0K1LMB5_9CAUD|nr:hypothetical protein HOR08_gp083 [Caulobacter phage Seuss]AKU43609.1 hypothetical protein CPT_Seuss83 [Caulobacter phage Seuss]